MQIKEKINCLYYKDTSIAYENLLELEALSETEDSLYPYFDDFLAMLKSDKYVIRVRGIRLLCKLAKWDADGRINDAIDEMLGSLRDEKPTAVRQALSAFEDVIKHKKELHATIKKALLTVDCFRFRDTMQPLIAKDIQRLLALIDAR